MTTQFPAAAVAAIVQTVPVVEERLRSSFKQLAESRNNSPVDHAVYAIAKMLHRQATARVELEEDAFREAMLHKLVRSFTPVTRPSKLRGGLTPFGSLLTALGNVKHSVRGRSSVDVTDEQAEAIRACAEDLHAEVRMRSADDLIARHVKPAPVRVKKPFTGPRG